MIKAVIFDMDGLLIDSEPIWFRAKVEFVKEFNKEWTWEDQKNTMGVSTQFWVNYVYEKIDKVIGKEEVLNGIIDRMKANYNSGNLELMPGANEALKFAKDNFKVGLASGSYKELLNIAVQINDWNNIFEEVLSSDDMERGKPHPDIYLEVIRRLGIKPEESVVLEDSRDGMKAGIAAGAKVIGVPSKEVPVPQEVLDSTYAVIETLHDFPQILKQ